MYLLDTNIIIAFLKGDSSVKQKLHEVGLKNCYISVITDYELTFGAYHAPEAYRQREIEKINQVTEKFCVLPLPTAKVWAEMKQKLIEYGKPLDDFDLMIAATAKANKLICVTDNQRHFLRVPGIEIENWINR